MSGIVTTVSGKRRQRGRRGRARRSFALASVVALSLLVPVGSATPVPGAPVAASARETPPQPDGKAPEPPAKPDEDSRKPASDQAGTRAGPAAQTEATPTTPPPPPPARGSTPKTTTAAAAPTAQCDGPLAPQTVVTCADIPAGAERVFTFTTAQASERLIVAARNTDPMRGSIGFTLALQGSAGHCWGGPYPQECVTKEPGTYTLTVKNSDSQPAAFAASYAFLRTAACTQLTDADLAMGAAARTGALPNGSVGDCYALDQPTDSVVRLAPGAAQPIGTIYDSAGTQVCTARYSPNPCTLSGPGPYKVFVNDGNAAASEYVMGMTRMSDPTGCVPLPLAPWGAAGTAVAAATLGTMTVDCRQVEVPAGRLVVSGPGMDLVTRDYKTVCRFYYDNLSCMVPTSGTYNLITVSGSTTPTPMRYAARSYTRTDGCLDGLATAFDQPAAQGEFVGEFPVDCRRLDAAAGDRIVLDGAWSTVVDATGAVVCQTGTGRPCTLESQAPYRVVTWGGSGAYQVEARRMNNPVGCPSIAPQAYGAAPSQHTVRCRTLEVTDPGRYFTNRDVYSRDGAKLDCWQVCVLSVGTYVALVPAPEASAPSAVVFIRAFAKAGDADGCVAASDRGAVDPLIRGEIATYGQYDCLTLPTPQGAPIALFAPTNGPYNGDVRLLDTDGNPQCDWNALYNGPCKPTGPAPYRLVVDGDPEPYAFAVARVDAPVGCANAPADTFATDDGREVRFDSEHVVRCLTIPAAEQGENILMQFRRTSGAGAAGLSAVSSADARRLCDHASADWGWSGCDLPSGEAFTVFVKGPTHDAAFKVVRRAISPGAAGCAAVPSVAIGAAAVEARLASATDARCFTLRAAAADRFRADLPESRFATAGQIVYGAVAPLSGTCWWLSGCDFAGGTDYTIVVLGRGIGAPVQTVPLNVWKVKTAGEWAAQCPTLKSVRNGIDPLTGIFTAANTGRCLVLPTKWGDEFTVKVSNTGGGTAVPEPMLFAADRYEQCANWGGGPEYRCKADDDGYTLFLLQSPQVAGDTPYRVEFACTTAPCGGLEVNRIAGDNAPAGTVGEVETTLYGHYLYTGATVQLTRAGQDPVTARVVDGAADGGWIKVRVNVSQALVGGWDVRVRPARGYELVLKQAFLILPPKPTGPPVGTYVPPKQAV